MSYLNNSGHLRPKNQSKATVVISDSHPMFRNAIRAALVDGQFVEVVGEACNGETSIREALTKKPDLMVLAFHLPDLSGIDVLRRLREAGSLTKVLFFTAGMTRQQTLEALQLGARGVLTKDAPAELFAKAIRCVLAGEYWIRRDLMAAWLDSSYHKTSQALPLTAREREIANEVLTGKTNREIAGTLTISDETVKRHIRNIYDKCGVSSRVELAMYITSRPGASPE
jgi:DNA-binding NarL/FixJ family response regulator